MTNPPSTTQEGVVIVELVEPTRGLKEGRTHARSHEKSKAASVDAFKPHVSKLETSMSAV